MSGSKIEVDVWRDEGPRIPSTPMDLKKHRMSPTWVGLLGTVAIHAFILQTLHFGTHAHPMKPMNVEGGAGATVDAPKGAMSETLILLELHSLPSNKSPLVEEIASQRASLKNPPITILSTDPLLTADIQADTTETKSQDATDIGDPALRAAMLGRYTGQIYARIERLWMRPRSAVNPQTVDLSSQASSDGEDKHAFRCQVRILQDDAGNIQEVQLLQCDSSPKWRQSLVAAILAASPLPIPSNQSVFSRALTINFTGYEYIQGAVPDGYAAPEISSL